MIVGVVRETFPGERRVALVPASLPLLAKAGATVLVERGAGVAAGFPDEHYADKGARLIDSRQQVISEADVLFQVRGYPANPAEGRGDLDLLRKDQFVIAMCDPLGNPTAIQEMAARQVTLFALEMIPRITRAQSMDVLSSQATIAGYRAVLLAAMHLPKMFPLLMTAAGTLSPAKVFVIGAGVAGLQAIATAKRLGAVVTAYDIRPEAREQIESLGAKSAELELESEGAQDQGGYAKDLGEDFYRRQREFMGQLAAQNDVVITTAAIPGKQSPLLITTAGIRRMPPGSIAVDLAAERGGNIEASQPDQSVELDGITILGPTNLPSEIPQHASQMFSSNITKFLLNMVQDGVLTLDLQDEIVAGTMATRGGEITHDRIRGLLDLPPINRPTEQSNDSTPAENSADAAPTTENHDEK